MPVTTTKRGPGIRDLARAIEKIKKSEVLVGIPAEKTQRKKEAINNASLLFIHTHGSALMHIPARPVLKPSIEANKAVITPHLTGAAKAVIRKDPIKAQNELERAGTIAANGAKRWFTDSRNNWAPNAAATIKAKRSDKPLIDTRQMRRSIVSVVILGE